MKLKSADFRRLPAGLAQYLERGTNVWLQSSPHSGHVSFMNRPGVFLDLESLAVQRRQLLAVLGHDRTRAVLYRIGFEQGRRDAARHVARFEENGELALHAGPLFGQLQGHYTAECVRFEFDRGARTLDREMLLARSAEAAAHRMVVDSPGECVCWTTAGYLSGHVSEILGLRVVTLERQCVAIGHEECSFVSRLDREYGGEADWVRDALEMVSIDREIAERDKLVASAQEAADRAQKALTDIKQKRPGPIELDNIVAEGEQMRPVLRRARQVAVSDLPVMLVGPPGSGRETLARAIHAASPRKAGPFEVLDCIGPSSESLTRQLFGFEKGAFAGATRLCVGSIARAHTGTLYLNEIAALGLEAQGLLLRAVQDGQVRPLGAAEPTKANARLIAATKRDPQAQVAAGTFREDLYYALGVATIEVPPLRERGNDVLRLCEGFLRELRSRYDKGRLEFTEEALRALMLCAWPGNVRQLRNVIEHAVVFGQGERIGLDDLPEDVLANRWKRPPEELSEEVIRAALRRSKGNRTRAADLLGVGRTTLWRSMKRLGLE